MKIVCDSLYIQGSSHRYCQDYAIHGDDYIIVSDGCSSSPNTDIGARILCHQAKKLIEMDKTLTYEQLGKGAIYGANTIQQLMGLPIECLDATLLVAFVIDRRAKIFVYGDGSVLFGRKGGGKEVININFESGAPYYLSYWLDNARQERYLKEFPGNKTVHDNIQLPSTFPVQWEMDITNIESITLCSDGFESFIDKENKKYEVDLNDVIGFKNTNGEFLQRQINNGLFKKLGKIDVYPYDDFGIASMVIKE